MESDTHAGLPITLTAAPYRLFELLGVMVSEDGLTVGVWDGEHSLAVDEGWVGDLTFQATPCQIQKLKFRCLWKIDPRP